MTYLQWFILLIFGWILAIAMFEFRQYKKSKPKFLTLKKFKKLILHSSFFIIITFVVLTLIYVVSPPPDYVDLRILVKRVSDNQPVAGADIFLFYENPQGENVWTTKIGTTNNWGSAWITVPITGHKEIYIGYVSGPLDGLSVVNLESLKPPWWKFDEWMSKEAPMGVFPINVNLQI